MLEIFDEFREKLDCIMHKCMDKRIVLYGYDYSGRFVAWYADYYHSIKPDYVITLDRALSIPYEFELFRETLFDYNYMDVKDAVVWLCVPETEEIRERLQKNGYVKNKTYFNFCEIVYEGTDIEGTAVNVQFLRWLEEKYQCDFVTRIQVEQFAQKIEGTHAFVGSTPKELFPVLDKCHISNEDSIFDFGCGKGGAMLSFLDYGIKKVGGVEYQDSIYETMIQNFTHLGFDDELKNGRINCIHGDASLICHELDDYNYFYYFAPFEGEVFEKTIENICQSIERVPRKAYIIYIFPQCHEMIEKTGKFQLTNRFTNMTRQRVVHVYVTK